mmetsp:Transcript_13350/g.46665  ORF Transcript_13350/g.46665 Transcript_13350/m.46665 type:complete len:271 (-) Transcript_13350:109-921(-)
MPIRDVARLCLSIRCAGGGGGGVVTGVDRRCGLLLSYRTQTVAAGRRHGRCGAAATGTRAVPGISVRVAVSSTIVAWLRIRHVALDVAGGHLRRRRRSSLRCVVALRRSSAAAGTSNVSRWQSIRLRPSRVGGSLRVAGVSWCIGRRGCHRARRRRHRVRCCSAPHVVQPSSQVRGAHWSNARELWLSTAAVRRVQHEQRVRPGTLGAGLQVARIALRQQRTHRHIDDGAQIEVPLDDAAVRGHGVRVNQEQRRLGPAHDEMQRAARTRV